MKLIHGFFATALAVAFCVPAAFAQSAPAADTPAAKPALEPPCSRSNIAACPTQVFTVNNIDGNDLYNNLEAPLNRSLSNNAKITTMSTSTTGHNAIVVRGTPDDLETAQKVINDLDRPKKNYRLTYTVTELDGSKQIGTEHYAMVMTSGQATTLKLGSKIPVATGTYSAGGSTPAGVQTQFTYVDVGMDFDATLTEMGNNAMLKSSVEQSSVAPETSEVAGAHEPIIRQASLRGETFLTPGKPVALGSMDIPGSTSRLQIEVLMEPLP